MPIRRHVDPLLPLLIVPEGTLRLEPGVDAPAQPPRTGEAIPVLIDLPGIQLVQRVEIVRDVATQRNRGLEWRAVGIAAGLDVDVRLKEHQSEKRPRLTLGSSTIGGPSVERADGRVEVRAHLLIHVQPEVLAVVAAQSEDHTMVACFLDGRTEIRATLALPH